jgi:hypothetical protein
MTGPNAAGARTPGPPVTDATLPDHIESPRGSDYHGNPIPLSLSEEPSSAESNTLE